MRNRLGFFRKAFLAHVLYIKGVYANLQPTGEKNTSLKKAHPKLEMINLFLEHNHFIIIPARLGTGH